MHHDLNVTLYFNYKGLMEGQTDLLMMFSGVVNQFRYEEEKIGSAGGSYKNLSFKARTSVLVRAVQS